MDKKEKEELITNIENGTAHPVVKPEYETELDKYLKGQYSLMRKTKDGYKILPKTILDIRLQVLKAKSFIDFHKIAVIYIEKGKVYIYPAVVYSNHLGIFCKFWIGTNYIVKSIEYLNEFIYPNGEREVGVILEEYSANSISTEFNIEESVKKQCKDIQDSLIILEKHYLSKKLSDIFSNDKYYFLGVFVIGALTGLLIGMAL